MCLSGSCCISRRCISHSERSGVVDTSGSMADWTWKRHWLADYQRQQDIAMNQVIDECLNGDNRELRPPRRMSGASVEQVIDEALTDGRNAASASKALSGGFPHDNQRRGHETATKKSRKCKTSLLIVTITTKSGDAVRTGTTKAGGMQRPRRSRASHLARHHRLHPYTRTDGP